MGKYALLVTLAAILGVTYLSQQSQQTSQEASEDLGDRQGIVISRQIARSVFNEGISKVKRSFGSVSDTTHEGQYEQGTYVLVRDVTVSGNRKEVDITAQGTFRDTTYEITGRAVRDTSITSMINGITANTPINFTVSGGGCSGGPCVSGIDAAGDGDRRGISLPPSGDADAVCNEFDGAVEGSGDGCDVQTRSTAHNDWVTGEMQTLNSEIQDAEGSSDVTVCDGCDVSSLSDSSGILYVTGELRFNGEEQWDGLVYVADGGSVRINGGGETRNINGGLVMSDSTEFDEDEEFDMNGGNAVKYNSETLKRYMDTLPTLRSVTVKVTDRTGRLLRPSDS